jgi:hypothetical protein
MFGFIQCEDSFRDLMSITALGFILNVITLVVVILKKPVRVVSHVCDLT